MPDQNWRAYARCAELVRAGQAEADIWHTGTGGQISNENRRAARICRHCPVRTECRDDAIDSTIDGQRPQGTILGGWVWRKTTVFPPHGGEHLADRVPAVEPDSRGGGQNRPLSAATDGRLFAAARAYIAGQPIDQVCAEYDLSKSTVFEAARICRVTPEQVEDVESGLVSYAAACRTARATARRRRMHLEAA